MVKNLLERFRKKNYKRQMNKNLQQKKEIKRKRTELYVKWKDYDNSFNSWIDIV